MKSIFVLAAAAAAIAAASPALAQSAPSCPQVQVHSPDSVRAGEPISYTAMISGGDDAVTPTYNWSVSAGTIESGQGTSTISVASPTGEATTVTATADLGGYDRSCSTAASATTTVQPAS